MASNDGRPVKEVKAISMERSLEAKVAANRGQKQVIEEPETKIPPKRGVCLGDICLV